MLNGMASSAATAGNLFEALRIPLPLNFLATG
jgi:hypothetical protein